MTKVNLFLACILYLVTSQIHAQTVYYEADQFQLIGKISEETETRYERLPAYLKERCRAPLWNLGKKQFRPSVTFQDKQQCHLYEMGSGGR